MLLVSERRGKSQIGSTTGTSGYVEGGGDINFATSQAIHIRMQNVIPRGAQVDSANLRVQVIAKNAATGQTCYNSIRAHAAGDAPVLTPGVAEGTRTWTNARVEWTLSWPAGNTADPAFYYINVKPILDELMARPDYQPGGYISFMLYTDNENGSDMGIRANNDFSNTPRLEVNVTERHSDLQSTINLAQNPNGAVLPLGAGEQVAHYYQSTFFGGFAEPANQGTVAVDWSFVRKPGIPSIRFTTGTPPSPTKSTGMTTSFLRQPEFAYVCSGWMYVPAYVNVPTWAGDPFLSNTQVTARGQWVPFCTPPTPVSLGQNVGTFSPTFYFNGAWQAGWQLWVSEPTILISSFRQMPFNGYSTPVMDGGGSPLISYRMPQAQTAVREWLPRRAMIRGGQLRRYPTYTKRTDGILQLTESVKGGPTILQLGPGPIPPNKTYAEL